MVASTTGPAPHGPMRWELVPKPLGGTRRLVRLTRADDDAYARVVARVAPFVDRIRGSGAFANKALRIDSDRLALHPWERERAGWRARVDTLMPDATTVAVADVRDCYRSIDAAVVRRSLSSCGAPPDAVASVMCWLHAFEDRGVRGLPVGPTPSAVLAEAVLAAGDQALEAVGALYVRWVDDVAVFTDGRVAATSALTTLRRAWAQLGLEANGEKTEILDATIAMRRLRFAAPSRSGDVR